MKNVKVVYRMPVHNNYHVATVVLDSKGKNNVLNVSILIVNTRGKTRRIKEEIFVIFALQRVWRMLLLLRLDVVIYSIYIV